MNGKDYRFTNGERYAARRRHTAGILKSNEANHEFHDNGS